MNFDNKYLKEKCVHPLVGLVCFCVGCLDSKSLVDMLCTLLAADQIENFWKRPTSFFSVVKNILQESYLT